jgi:alginate O-acetyltransferase complex protein AlgI
VELPIGISFFTFTQIAFLVDAYRGQAKEYNPIHYGLFVTFFPHLIAGPILHHKEMMPQFARPETCSFSSLSMSLGLSWFAVGLFKKVALADSIAPYADKVFDAADKGAGLGPYDTWSGAICYTLQIYFDFSGYSDMAIGLALMFGITFPLNFLSPYKSTSLIEFWRRWHMTLSRFLRDYLYIPLGGNRSGTARRYLNLFLTMVIGGLWHGASWNFVLWGAIHGCGLLVNHAYRNSRASRAFPMPAALGLVLTLLVVICAWVPFRADTLAGATTVWSSMVSAGNGSEILAGYNHLILIAVLSLIALAAPNTATLFAHPSAGAERAAIWTRSPAWGLTLGAAMGVAFAMSLTMPTSFLYFRF